MGTVESHRVGGLVRAANSCRRSARIHFAISLRVPDPRLVDGANAKNSAANEFDGNRSYRTNKRTLFENGLSALTTTII